MVDKSKLAIATTQTQNRFLLNRTYAKTLYIAHDNFDELHALSRALAELCGTQSPNYFY